MLVKAWHLVTHTFVHISYLFPARNAGAALAIWGKGPPLRKDQPAFQRPDSGNCLRGDLAVQTGQKKVWFPVLLSRLLLPKALVVFAFPFSSAT